MSYIVIRVYSFECDICGAVTEVGGEPDIKTAERVLRRTEHWGVAPGANSDHGHYCPKHPDGVVR